MKQWRTTLTAGAARNCNISLKDASFFLRSCIGGSNESEAPAKRLKVHFHPSPTAEMWIYGDRKILTPRKGPVAEFFQTANIMQDKPVKLIISEISPGELRIERAA